MLVLLLALVLQLLLLLQDGHWDRKRFANGVELRGKTVGVVGLGMIGAEVARRCLALDMKARQGGCWWEGRVGGPPLATPSPLPSPRRSSASTLSSQRPPRPPLASAR